MPRSVLTVTATAALLLCAACLPAQAQSDPSWVLQDYVEEYGIFTAWLVVSFFLYSVKQLRSSMGIRATGLLGGCLVGASALLLTDNLLVATGAALCALLVTLFAPDRWFDHDESNGD